MNDLDRSLAYFRQAKAHTDLGLHRSELAGLPADLPGLCEVVRGWVLHPFDTPLLGVELPPNAPPGTVSAGGRRPSSGNFSPSTRVPCPNPARPPRGCPPTA